MAYWSNVHETTKFTPYYAFFGHDIRLPLNVTFNSTNDSVIDVPSYVEDLRMKLIQQLETRLTWPRKDSKLCMTARFTGSLTRKVIRFSKEFHHPCSGPCLVVSRTAGSTYRIQKLGTRKRSVVHFDQLHPFIGSTFQKQNFSSNAAADTDPP